MDNGSRWKDQQNKQEIMDLRKWTVERFVSKATEAKQNIYQSTLHMRVMIFWLDELDKIWGDRDCKCSDLQG